MITNFSLRARHVATVITMLLLAALASAPAIAQEQYVDPVQVKMALYDMVRIIERTTLRDSKVSDALLHSDPEMWRGIQNPQDVLKAADFFRKNDEARETQMRQRLMNPLSDAAMNNPLGSQPFSPNYPFPDANYAVLVAFGLVTAGDFTHRSNGVGFIGIAIPNDPNNVLGWVAYRIALTAYAAFVRVAQLGCTAVAGVPALETGTCAAYAGFQGLLDLVSIPLNAADAWDAQIDSAEMQAGYENGVTLLNSFDTQDATLDKLVTDLQSHDVNIDGDLQAHDTRVNNQVSTHDTDIKASLSGHDNRIKTQLGTHDTEIKALLATIVANQVEIIKLLKTPEGKRPGWGSEGYK